MYINIYFLSKEPPWNKLSNAFLTLGSWRIFDGSFSVRLDSMGCWGWVLEERDVFKMFKIRFCNWAAWGFWIAVAAGRIGISATTKMYNYLQLKNYNYNYNILFYNYF